MIFRSAESAAMQAAIHVREHARRAIAGRGRFLIALAGGTTPQTVYRNLARMTDIEWPRVEVFFGDERCVPPDDPASNYRMAREALLEQAYVRDDKKQVKEVLGDAKVTAFARFSVGG